MGRALLGILALFCLVSVTFPSVQADLWNRTCITTGGTGVEYALLCDGLCSNPGAILLNSTKICPDGCNNQTQSCETPYNVPSEFFVLAIVAFLGIAGLFIVIANKFKDDWGIIPILFYVMSIIFIVMAIGAMGSYFVFGQSSISTIINTAYLAAALVMFIFLAYVFLRFILAFALKFLSDVNKRGR